MPCLLQISRIHPEIAEKFFAALSTGDVDVVVGTREVRADPWPARIAASVFWGLYRRIIQPQIPRGGVDLFGCNRAFRDHLIRLNEANTSLVALLFWLGFRRKTISYVRRARPYGKSAWTIRRKLKYLSDSVFAFSDLPVRLLFYTGLAGLLLSGLFGLLVTIAAPDGRHRGTRICRDRTYYPVLRRAEHIRPGNRWRVCMARLREHEAASRLSRAVD